MADATIKLQSLNNDGKSLEIISGGTTSTEIVLDFKRKIDPLDPNLEMELMSEEELKSTLFEKSIGNRKLSTLLIRQPADNAVNNNWNDKFIWEVSSSNKSNKLVTLYVEISSINTFAYSEFKLTNSYLVPSDGDTADITYQDKEGEYPNIVTSDNKLSFYLQVEDLINSGLLLDTIYYCRAKYSIEENTSDWCNSVMFTIPNASYKTPILNNVTLGTTSTNDQTYYDGNIILNINPEEVANGTPGTPNVIELQITETVSRKSKVLTINKDKYIHYLPIIPTLLHPNSTYEFQFRYINQATNLASPWSNVFTFSIPLPNVYPIDLHINYTTSSINSNPTLGINNLYVDYNYFDNLDINWDNVLLPDDKITEIKELVKNCTFEHYFKLTLSGNEDTPYTDFIYKRNYDEIVDNYYKGCLFSYYSKENKKLTTSTSFKLFYNFYWKKSSGDNISGYFNPPATYNTGLEFTTPAFEQTIPQDNLNDPQYENSSGFGYYGEITINGLMSDDITYYGEFIDNKTYPKYAEVVIDNELYITTASTSTTSTDKDNLVKITKENQSTYYKSGLPSGKWLIKQLGIPINLKSISGIVNSTDGWLKVYNKANQILYIAKKPFITNIDYDYINERWLTGNGSRTIRIGLNLYKVRLLEYSTSSYIKQVYTTNKNSKINIENEIELYKQLYNGLNAYMTNDDLGITDDNSITWTNHGAIKTSTKESKVIITNGSIDDMKTDIENTTLKLFRPVLELIQEGYEPYRKHLKELKHFDKWSDSGYYGKVHASDLLSTSELINMYELLELNTINASPIFYKFYYHGMNIFIPTTPIGNNISYKYLQDKFLHNGINSGYKTINNTPTKFLLPSLSTVIQNTTEDFDMFTEDNNNYRSVVRDLLGRTITNLPTFFISSDSKWETDEMANVDDIIWRDTVTNNSTSNIKRITISNNNLVQRELEDTGYYLPMVITEALDLTKNLTYPKPNRTPTITKEQVQVTRYRIEEQQVEQVKEVTKQKYVTDTKDVIYIDKVYTGKLNYPLITRESQRYGILLFHASKDASAYLASPLYKRDMLNISLSNNELAVRYSVNAQNEILLNHIYTKQHKFLQQKPYMNRLHDLVYIPCQKEGNL